MGHDLVFNFHVHFASVLVIIIVALNVGVVENAAAVNNVPGGNSLEEGAERTKQEITDILAIVEAIQTIETLSKEDLEDLRNCISSCGGIKSCLKPDASRRKRWSIAAVFAPLVNVVKDVILRQIEGYIKSYQGNHTCYKHVGCFEPRERMALKIGGPRSPESIGTEIELFPNRSSLGIKVNHTMWREFYIESQVNVAKPLFGITHGFTRDMNVTWMYMLKDALMDTLDCNVLMVKWIKGAMFPDYAVAAVNTPLPGVLLSLLLEEMMVSSNCSLMPENMHLIGFSLGAHVAGFAARHFERHTKRKLGRITGLDPAGPLFEKTNVSLSAADADFVDIIHTSAGQLKNSKLGLNESKGHVDFYPNGGSQQPGCDDHFDFACSHNRAQALFIESVTSECSFTSCSCKGGWRNYDDCKKNANSSLAGEMGYHSINRTGRGDQYLKTNDHPPYCQG